jgi:hypothetical protein
LIIVAFVGVDVDHVVGSDAHVESVGAKVAVSGIKDGVVKIDWLKSIVAIYYDRVGHKDSELSITAGLQIVYINLAMQEAVNFGEGTRTVKEKVVYGSKSNHLLTSGDGDERKIMLVSVVGLIDIDGL